MSRIKNLLDKIVNCEICEGEGITDKYMDFESGDFGFEWCECNPERLAISEIYSITK